ncbi:hypothetical protein SERLADRAFT_377091 [Serpula lacrymans var. lacrymans S7.9]|nr:uncharacterized protein SERLADRAFT_377091 [Serpula lacrymans var. lacrymans S7.9]EGO31230.1 hypothetical protein SERLADRAFT_377091 [Serpula lacrymans var. lacrymans S7.9]
MAIDRSLPPLPGINGQMTSMQGSGDSTYPRKSNPIRTRGKVDGHGNDEPTLQRPKSAHASVGLAVDPTADIGGTPSPSVSTTSSNTKRGSRKLSLTAPILGFGRKKEKDKEREKKAKPVAPPSAFLSPYLSPKY